MILSINNKKGLTLLELMIVISIISIVLGYGYSALSKFQSIYNLKAASRLIYSDMQYARVKAVKYNCQYRMVFDKNKMFYTNGIYEIQKGTSNKNSKYRIENQDTTFIVRDFSNFKGVYISKATNNPIFNTNGTISSCASIILANNNNNEIKISTSVAGRIKIR